MTVTAPRIVLAAAVLSFATYILGMHYWILTTFIKNKIKKTDGGIPSGVALVPVILSLLALIAGNQSKVIRYWAVGVIVFDPMNWALLGFFRLRKAK
jgi:hypothetical protein